MAVAKDESRQWKEGSISGIDVIRTPFGLAEVDLSITTDTIVYEMQLANGLHKKDLIPFVGIVTIAERQKHTHLDVVVGGKVKFAVSGEHGWLMDGDLSCFANLGPSAVQTTASSS